MRTIRNWAVTKLTIFGIIMALLLMAGTGLSACAPKSNEIVMGALLSLTGSWSSGGESGQAAIEIATEDINAYLDEIGAGKSINIVIEDTQSDPATALEKLKYFDKKGIKVVIGPLTSAEAEAVKNYADENGILLLSPSSTSPLLAIPGDNTFRFSPDDRHQAEAVARLMWEDGIKAIVPMWRGDVWGDGLSQALADNFEELGGKVFDGVSYSLDTTDFSQDLESLKSKVSQAVADYGNAEVIGVHLVAFSEAVPIFNLAGAQDSVLSMVKWYGSDGNALEEKLVNSNQAARFAAATGFPCALYGEEEETEKYGLLAAEIQSKIGRHTDAYAVAAYDTVWVATLAQLAAGATSDIDALKKATVQTADSYFGATGWTMLNEAGDRQFWDYDFWTIKDVNGAFQWQRVARYQADPGEPGRLISESTFPSKPIRIVSGWLGGTEQFLKAISPQAEELMGIPVVVENKVGSGGLDAIREFQAAPKDGYTLLAILDFDASDFAQGKTEINPAEDWVPILIGNLAISQIYTRADEQRYSDWDELVSYAKEHPGLKVATLGTPLYMENLCLANLESAFEVQFQQVPYENSPERYASLISGKTDLLIEQPGDVSEFLDEDKFKPILTLWSERVRGFEDVPTAAEKGADFTPLLRLRGLAVAKGTPAERIDFLQESFQSAFSSDDFQQFLRERDLDLVPYPDDPVSAMRQQIEIYQQLYQKQQ